MNSKAGRIHSTVLGAALLALSASNAWGDDSGLYGAKGMPLGGFRLFPTLALDANYDDNVYRQDTGTIGSWYFVEEPELRLASQWVRHELDFYGGAGLVQYTDTPSDNQDNWNVGGYGRLDIHTGVFLEGSGEYQILHEPRTSPDQPAFAAHPTQYAQSTAGMTFEYHPARWAVVFGGSFQRLNYDPTELIGAPPLDNSDRDENDYSEFLKLGYEFSPGYAAFVRGTYDSRVFDLSVDRNGLHRNSDGYAVDSGLDMQITSLIKGNLFVGYLQQNYSDARLTDVNGFDFGASLDWTPSALWTVDLSASRTLSSTTLDNASAEDNQQVALHVDWQTLPYLVVQSNIGYLDESFPGISRDDNYWSAGIGLKYILNANVAALVGYEFSHRTSNAPGEAFADNQISLSLLLQE